MKHIKTELTVQPITGYKLPKYPRIGEIEANAVLSECPYPFRSSFKSCVATVGLTAILTQLCAAESPAKTENPFQLSQSGLPFQTSPFGAGMPSYLSEEQARRVIDKVFAESGYHLREHLPFTDGENISFVADGYDPDKKIGYVWGDWESLDHRDAIISWSVPKLDKEAIDRIFSDEQDADRQYQDSFKMAQRYIEGHELSDSVKAEYEEALSIADPREQLERLASIMQRLEPGEDPNRISLREAQELENRAASTKEYIALISCFDRRFQYRSWGMPENSAKRAEIEKLQGEYMASESREERHELEMKIEALAAEDALSALEEAVRSYIEWAQRQGI